MIWLRLSRVVSLYPAANGSRLVSILQVLLFELLAPAFDLGVVENFSNHPAQQPFEVRVFDFAQ